MSVEHEPSLKRRGEKHWNRRTWLAQTGLGTVAAATWPWLATSWPHASRADKPTEVALIVRSRRPLDLETPVSALDAPRTPNGLFFVRSHFGVPGVAESDRNPWTFGIAGLVNRPQSLTRDNLAKFANVEITAVLQCSGNGRANFRPRLPGVAWDRGAVGNASWRGVRLLDILKEAQLKAGAAHVHFLGADGPPSPKTPLFLRSIPLEKALDPDTLIASQMNGEPLPTLHGGPYRLVVPGWAGNHWMKWVRQITVSDVEAPGFYMQTGYRMPRTPAPPDAVLKPADLVPVTTMNVKSLITAPAEGARLKPGRIEVRGVAWTGEGHVTRVEVADAPGADAPWRPTAFRGDLIPWAWRPWSLVIEATRPGPITLRARATDSNGATQPVTTPWNRSGYLWNGIDHVTCEVG